MTNDLKVGDKVRVGKSVGVVTHCDPEAMHVCVNGYEYRKENVTKIDKE